MKLNKKAPSRSSSVNLKGALVAAVSAARAVGKLMIQNRHSDKRASEVSQHDIKLELDVRSQKLIERRLRSVFPQVAVVGEEGVDGDPDAAFRWVIDPIDGTVNFTYDIPHACVSIALQRKAARPGRFTYPDGFETVLGVVYDPFTDEMFTAIKGEPARLNGRIIRASKRNKLAEAVVSIGFAKSRENLEGTLPYFNKLVHRIRKIRMMGAAALGVAYVAAGRFDAYIERGIRLWDIAAGGIILECAGGEFWRQPIPGEHAYRMIASNGLLRKKLRVPDWNVKK